MGVSRYYNRISGVAIPDREHRLKGCYKSHTVMHYIGGSWNVDEGGWLWGLSKGNVDSQ